MAPNWTTPPVYAPRAIDPDERGRVLVDLLHLADALPPVPHDDLDIPPFRELCGRG
ncbi:MAG TPA: hypothetical protein VNQ73_03550 [Ilumatobacter sp.]|nr:hypothetical protein [Ilumatobacter sp.]